MLPRMSLPRLLRSPSAVCKNGPGMFVLSASFLIAVVDVLLMREFLHAGAGG